MNEQDKILQAIEEYRKAFRKLNRITQKFESEVKFDNWRTQVNQGRAIDPELSNWLKNLSNYYGEKDHPFAEYLESLL